MSRRAAEIGTAVSNWEWQEGAVGFVTMTMRHNNGQDLADLWDALAYAWGRTTAGKAWLTDRERFGVAAWCRVVEVTRTWRNGWHVHVHALVFLDAGRGRADLSGLHARMFGRWERALVRKGLDAPLMVGQDAQILDGPGDERIAKYLTKATDDVYGVGLELMGSQSKTARDAFASFTPWELLTMVDEATDEADFFQALDAWTEWENGSKGRRQIAWSKGARDMLEVGYEETDEEIASQAVGTEDDTVLFITRAGWRTVNRTPRLAGTILDTLKDLGPAALSLLLEQHGIEYEEA